MGQVSSSRLFLVILAGAAVALGGCGRRGPLELPPGAPEPAGQNAAAQADRQAAALNDVGLPGVVQSPNQVVTVDRNAAQIAARPPARPINAPPEPRASTFILDPLL